MVRSAIRWVESFLVLGRQLRQLCFSKRQFLIRHPKTGVKGWVPLDDEEGTLYPDIEEYLATLPRLGTPIVLTVGRRGPVRPYSAEYAQHKVREARTHAQLPSHVTLDAYRHGGLVELGDAGTTEFEGMAASMHKTPQALRLYVKHSETQRLNAARRRPHYIEPNETGARVRIERQTKSQNGARAMTNSLESNGGP